MGFNTAFKGLTDGAKGAAMCNWRMKAARDYMAAKSISNHMNYISKQAFKTSPSTYDDETHV